MRKALGRPKRKRSKNPDEPQNPYKVSRAGGNVICENYHQAGHNVRGCKDSVILEISWQEELQSKRPRKVEHISQTRYNLIYFVYYFIIFFILSFCVFFYSSAFGVFHCTIHKKKGDHRKTQT